MYLGEIKYKLCYGQFGTPAKCGKYFKQASSNIAKFGMHAQCVQTILITNNA